MKKFWKSTPVLGLIAVVAISAMVVAAIVVSNTVVFRTNVADSTGQVTLSKVAVNTDGKDGGDRPDLPGEGTWSYVGTEYDVGIRLVSTQGLSNVKVVFSIAAADISESDVTVMYWETTSDTWETLTMVDNGDTLDGTFGPADGFPVWPGYDATTPLLVTFNKAATYTTSVHATNG